MSILPDVYFGPVSTKPTNFRDRADQFDDRDDDKERKATPDVTAMLGFDLHELDDVEAGGPGSGRHKTFGGLLRSYGYDKRGKTTEHSVKSGNEIGSATSYEHPDGDVVKVTHDGSWTHFNGGKRMSGYEKASLAMHLAGRHGVQAGIMVAPRATAQPLYNQPAPVPDPSIAANQAIDQLSEAIKIPRSKDPLFQLQDQHVIVAVQVVQDGSAQGFTVDQTTLKRQLLSARRLKLHPFSVAISLLTNPPELYYRTGLGNFALHTMTSTKDAQDLKKALLTH
jgi:hypothetical protein